MYRHPMSVSLRFRLSLVVAVLAVLGCTRLKEVPDATASASPSPSPSGSPAASESPATFPSPTPSPVPPTPTPQPTPAITVLAPTASTDFGADAVDIAFTVTVAAGRKVASAAIAYNGKVLRAFDTEGPGFRLEGWNPNQVNNTATPPDTTPVKSGDQTLTLTATDDAGQQGKTEFAFRKPLRIGTWTEITAMPAPASHFGIFGDSAQPPVFMSLWGSIDGIETTVFPRNQVFGFNPAGTGSWTTLSISGNSVPRAAYGSAVHPSGQLVYVVGGRTGKQDLATIDTFAPLRKVTEQSLTVMAAARRDTAAVFADGFVYAIGGKTGDTPLYSVERIAIGADGNPQGDFKARANTLTARSGANAAVRGHEIWLFGGGFRPIEIYDIAKDTWRFLTGLDGTVVAAPEAWSNSLMIAAEDRYYFFGGVREDGQPVDTVYEFNPGSLTWRTLGTLPAPEVADDRPETRLAGFFHDHAFYLMGGIALPSRKVSTHVFRATTF